MLIAGMKDYNFFLIFHAFLLTKIQNFHNINIHFMVP